MSDSIAKKHFTLAGEQERARTTAQSVAASLARRYAAERRFRACGAAAVAIALAALVTLFVTIFGNGYSAFVQTQFHLQVPIDAEAIDPTGERNPEVLAAADYGALVKQALRAKFPEVQGREERRDLNNLISSGADHLLRSKVLADPGLIGRTVDLWAPAADDVDVAVKHGLEGAAESGARLSDRQLEWLRRLQADGVMAKRFNLIFLTSGDSRDPEMAGILGALVGSFLTLIVTILLAFPLGAAAAIYLEEYAPKNIWTQILEANINNLAAVPSIVFGLLGLAVFLNVFGMPRSAPLVGGVVLAIMTLPTIIIAGRAALKSVPPSIREAAYGLGASPIQMVFHHVLPLAMPGMLTGSIIGMARALGETAPLLMIGMVAFIVDVPHGFTEPATVLPVQVFLWSDSPERAFVEKTSGAIIVLLVFLVVMNAVAIFLRNRFEKRW